MNHYITQIKIEELRHLSDINIDLKTDMRTNLLLTGKNGSGKTTVLQALKKYLTVISDKNLQNLEKNYPKWLKNAKVTLENTKDDKEDLKCAIRREVKDNSAFTAFKRWILWDNKEKYEELIEFCKLFI